RGHRTAPPSPQSPSVVERYGLVDLSNQTRIPAAAEQSLSHRYRKTSLNDNIPIRVGDPIPRIDSRGSVVIEMVPFDMPEVRILEVVIVLAVVDPLFSNIALNDASEHHGQCVRGENKTHGQRDQKNRKQVFQLTIYMSTIERAFVMPEVSRVKVLVSQAGEKLLVPLL